jgi:hypothetical protein
MLSCALPATNVVICRADTPLNGSYRGTLDQQSVRTSQRAEVDLLVGVDWPDTTRHCVSSRHQSFGRMEMNWISQGRLFECATTKHSAGDVNPYVIVQKQNTTDGIDSDRIYVVPQQKWLTL